MTNDGFFKLICLNTPYEELKKEVARVFAKFPKIKPAFYNNHRVEMQFVFPLSFPLSNDIQSEPISIVVTPKKDINDVLEKEIITSKNSLYKSHLNIPFTHQRYVDYEYAMHKNNKHTGSKPYLYKDVNQFINLDSVKNKFLKPAKKTWVGKKVWNEHLLAIQEKDYWFNLDVLFDVQLGKDNSNDVSFTYNNSRIVQINGGLGDKFSYSATIYESQA